MAELGRKASRRTKAAILAAIASFVIASARAESPGCAQGEILKLIETNDFNVARGLRSYEKLLSPDFPSYLRSLDSSRQWIDSGAGRSVAIHDFLEHGAARKPRVTAIVYRDPPGSKSVELLRTGRYRKIEGRYLLDIPASELGSAALVTDVYGPLIYSKFDEVLVRYLESLDADGRLFTLLHAGQVIIEDEAGRVTLKEYFGRCRGLRVRHVGPRQVPGKYAHAAIELERTPGPIQVPKLELVSETMTDNGPYKRYRLVAE